MDRSFIKLKATKTDYCVTFKYALYSPYRYPRQVLFWFCMDRIDTTGVISETVHCAVSSDVYIS